LPAAIAVVIFCLLGIAAAVGRIASAPAVAVQPTPALPVIIIQKEPAPAAPVVERAPVQQPAMQPAEPHYVVAFASPGGDVLGPIPMPALSALLGRWGDGWVMTDWQGGQVWIRAADMGINLIDLAPQIAPAQPLENGPRVISVEQPAPPAVEQPAYQVSNDQPPPPAPPERPAVALPAPAALPAQQEQPTAAPISPGNLGHDTEVEAEWARQQLRLEHPEWQNYPPGQ
jgi:hypothetical protein